MKTKKKPLTERARIELAIDVVFGAIAHIGRRSPGAARVLIERVKRHLHVLAIQEAK